MPVMRRQLIIIGVCVCVCCFFFHFFWRTQRMMFACWFYYAVLFSGRLTSGWKRRRRRKLNKFFRGFLFSAYFYIQTHIIINCTQSDDRPVKLGIYCAYEVKQAVVAAAAAATKFISFPLIITIIILCVIFDFIVACASHLAHTHLIRRFMEMIIMKNKMKGKLRDQKPTLNSTEVVACWLERMCMCVCDIGEVVSTKDRPEKKDVHANRETVWCVICLWRSLNKECIHIDLLNGGYNLKFIFWWKNTIVSRPLPLSLSRRRWTTHFFLLSQQKIECNRKEKEWSERTKVSSSNLHKNSWLTKTTARQQKKNGSCYKWIRI